MLNSGRRGRRAQDGYGVISVNENFNQQSYPIPTINSYAVTDESYNPSDDLALNTAGGQTVVIYGSGFRAGVVVNINGSNITTTLLDQGRLAITSPALSSGSYTIYASNTNGATAMYVPGLIYSGTPTWSTATDLGIKYETKSYTQNLVATSDSTVTYSLAAGSTLPDGITLNSSTGELSGTLPAESGSTAYAFTIIASDAELQDTTRQFSLTVNTDVVTWATPSTNYVISSYEYAPIANVTANATSAAGYSVMYGANTLPTGITLDSTSGLISGTIETVGNTDTRLTATANVTNRSATRDVKFNVNQDVVTWSNPATDTIYTLPQGTAISPVVLSAASAAGFGVQYTANSLPTGVSLSGGTISGTPTQTETVYTALTATANTTSRTAVRYVTWTVSIASDTYWKNNTLLLSADSSTQTPSFVSDNSINNAQLTVAGDTRATNFNPYQHGYYSNYFDGTGDYLTVPASINNALGTDFTVECWIYQTGTQTTTYGWGIVGTYDGGSNGGWSITINRSTSGYGIGFVHANAWQATYNTYLPTNTWHHIAVTRSGSSLRIFLNGVQVAVNSNYSTSDTVNAVNYIGSQGTGQLFTGYISNLRVVKGTALYTTTFTPPTSPLTAVSGTSLLTCQSNGLVDNSPNIFTITKNGDTTVSSVHPFTTVYQAGTQYYSTKFDGTGDYLTVPHNTALNLSSGDYTIEAWIYSYATPAANQLILDKGGLSGSYYEEYSLALDSSNKIVMYIGRGDGSTFQTVTTTGGINTGTWNHVAWVKSGSSHIIYINGVSQATLTQTITMADNGAVLYIGYQNNAASNRYFNGNISNLRIVKGTAVYTTSFTPSTTPLTAVANTSLLTCQDSTFKDNSTNNFAITSYGDAKPVAVSPFTSSSYTNTQITTYGSGYFDGSGDYLYATNNTFDFGTGDFTVELWWYPTSTASYMTLIDTSAQGDGTATGRFLLDHNTGGYARLYTAAGTTQLLVSGAGAIKVNQWHHIAVTRSGITGRLFVNGILVNTNTNMNTNFLAKTNRPIIGANGYNNSTSGFASYIADIRVIKGTALYTSSFVPPQAPLTNISNTQLLTLQSNGSHNNSTFKDSSSFNNLVTRAGNATNGTFSPYGDNWSTYFGTTTMGVQTPASSLTNIIGTSTLSSTSTFTIEAWINPTSRHSGGASQLGFIAGSLNVTGGNADWGFGPDSSGYLTVWWWNGSSIVRAVSTNTVSLNTWTHVSTSISNGLIKIFINGQLETLTGTTTVTSVASSLSYFTTGGYTYAGTTWQGFNGYISNLRVTKAALYSANFTPSTTPLTAVANTSLLIHQSNRIIDNSPNNYALTVTNAPQIQKFSPFSTVTVPKYYSTYFNGSTDYITAPGATSPYQSFDWSGTSWTIEGWFNFNSVAATKGLFTYPDLLEAKYDGTNLVFIYRNNPASAVWTTNSSAYALQTNTWYHIALVLNNGSMRCYVNGTAIGTASTGVGIGARGSVTGFGEKFAIGTNDNYFFGSPDSYMNGYISNFRVSKIAVYTGNFTVPTSPLTITQDAGTNISALTAGQVTLLTCQDNTLIDKTSNNWTITAATATVKPLPQSPFTPAASSPTNYSPVVFGGSMYFDGTGDYLQTATGLIHTDITQTDYTVECWVYNQGAGAERYIFSQRGSGTGWEMRINATNTVSFFFTGGTTFTSATTIKANEWTHIAVARVGTAMTMYINGVKDNTGSGTQSNGTSAYASYGLWLGYSTSGGGYMLGYISDAKVTRGVALYTSNFYPGASPATPTTTIGANTYPATYLLSGTGGGVFDATRTVDLETVADAKVTNFSPYNGSYYSNYFDGSGDNLTVADSAALELGNSDFTIEFWINLLSSTGQSTILAHRASDITNGPLAIFRSSGTTSLVMYLATGSSGWDIFNGASIGSLTVGSWTHVSICRSGSNFYKSINGAVSSLGTSSATIGDVSAAWSIGADLNSNSTNGQISNLRIVKGTALYTSNFTPSTTPLTAISGTQLLTCQSNKFVDNSTNNFTITRNGDTKVVTQNPFQVNSGLSYYFDGTGDYMTVSTGTGTIQFGTGDFTIETWVYFEANNGTYNPFIRVNGGSQLDFGFDFSVNQLKYNTSASILANAWTPTVGRWYHIALVRSAGVAKIYVDGTNISGAGAVDSFNHSLNSATTYYRIGGSDFNSAHVMRGYLTDLRITKAARTISVPSSPVIAK